VGKLDVGGNVGKVIIAFVLVTSLSILYAEEAGIVVSGTDVLRYDIFVEVKPDAHSFNSIASMDIEIDEAVDKIVFAFSKDLSINRITVDGKLAEFSHNGDELLILLDDRLKGTKDLKVVVEYEGFSGDDTGFAWSYVGDVTHVIYESLWYPTINGDRAPAGLEIVVPEGFSAITSGDFIGVETKGDRKAYLWEDSEPAYGISFAVGRYRIKVQDIIVGDTSLEKNPPAILMRSPSEYAPRKYGEISKSVRLSCYLLEQDFYLADDCLRTSKNVLEYYISEFGGYPYNRFSIVEMPDQFFGGHGDQGFILLQADILRRSAEEFLAHEIAHNWWGALVSAEGGYNLMPFFGIPIEASGESSNNHWLNEGFATYSSLMYIEDQDGSEAMVQSLKGKRREYFQVNEDAPISEITEDYGSPDYHAIVYSKGGFVLHMLRHVVGDEGFSMIIDRYLQQFEGKSADIEAFEAVSEEVYGGKLDWFFDAWLRSTALPDYAVGKVSTEPCEGGYCTKVEVLQKGDLVKMPLDVTIVSSAGKETKRLWMDEKRGYINFVSSSKPGVVELDSDYWILEGDRTNNLKVLNYFSRAGLKALFDSILNRAA